MPKVLVGCQAGQSSRPGSKMVAVMAWIQLFRRALDGQIKPQI